MTDMITAEIKMRINKNGRMLKQRELMRSRIGCKVKLVLIDGQSYSGRLHGIIDTTKEREVVYTGDIIAIRNEESLASIFTFARMIETITIYQPAVSADMPEPLRKLAAIPGIDGL